jgi:hypothetical protein
MITDRESSQKPIIARREWLIANLAWRQFVQAQAFGEPGLGFVLG